MLFRSDGDEVEYRLERHDGWSDWKSVDEPFGLTWYKEGAEYRIKPQPKEPQYLYVYEDSFCGTDDVDIRAGTRIMRKKVKEWECNYLGKIKLENDNGSA